MGIIMLMTVLGWNCGGRKPDTASLPAGGVSPRKVAALASRRICFGHQSVGAGIVDGIAAVAGGGLTIRETRDAALLAAPSFVHFRVGTNRDGRGKCDDFRRVMEHGMGRSADIAFFKLCYVDVTKDTDVEALFAYYAKTMDALAAEFPRVKFVHCTVPLTTSEPTAGVKAGLKRLAGRPFWEEEDNLRRNVFNRLLRERYGGSVFDLARWEATFPDGTENEFSNGRCRYLSLIPAYTGDGGHMNETARALIACRLLDFLHRQAQ